MSPSPEPVAPSPEEKAIDIALAEINAATAHLKVLVDTPGGVVFIPTRAILTRLYLAAKIEGLQESANAECDRCKAGVEVRNANGDWFHPDPVLQDFHYCDACPQVMDTLAKLREEAK